MIGIRFPIMEKINALEVEKSKAATAKGIEPLSSNTGVAAISIVISSCTFLWL